MHYVALMDGREYEVEVTEIAAHRYRVVVDGKTLDVDAAVVGETTLSLIHEGRAYTIESERREEGGENLLVRGHIVPVEVLDLRRMRLRQAQASTLGADGPVEIRSPMPGKVVAVLVQEGAEVQEGQGLVVVEAMKMENELRSPRAGVVQRLTAREGEAVDGGAVLCVVG